MQNLELFFPKVVFNEERKRQFGFQSIESETDRLDATVLWGPPGIESFLAQLYPDKISLFFDYMNVQKARNEAVVYQKTLDKFGVKTVFARDLLAEKIDAGKVAEAVEKERPISEDFLTNSKFDRQKTIDIICYAAERLMNGFYPNQVTDVNKKLYQDIIASLIDADIERYGEQEALALNYLLSVDPNLPMGNLIYARDQMNIVFGKRIRASMKKDIRQPEINLYDLIYHEVDNHDEILISEEPDEQFYKELKQTPGLEKIKIPERDTFEGGDLYIHNNTVYIGVGARTTMGAAIKIYEAIKEEMTEKGYKMAIVYDEDAQTRPDNEQMNFMHLDTWSYIVGENEIELYVNEAQRRKVFVLDPRKNTKLPEFTGKNFEEYLKDKDYTILSIQEEDQQEFGCNNLFLGTFADQELSMLTDERGYIYPGEIDGLFFPIPYKQFKLGDVPEVSVMMPENSHNKSEHDLIIIPLETNKDTITKLLNVGKTLVFVPLIESTRGYGAAHCMTGQWRRLSKFFKN